MRSGFQFWMNVKLFEGKNSVPLYSDACVVQKHYWTTEHHGLCCADLWLIALEAAVSSTVIHWPIFLHEGFNWCNGLWCHYWILLDLVKENPPQNQHHLQVSHSTCILAVVTDMIHHTELSFSNEFQRDLLFTTQKTNNRTLLFLFGACCKWTAIFVMMPSHCIALM